MIGGEPIGSHIFRFRGSWFFRVPISTGSPYFFMGLAIGHRSNVNQAKCGAAMLCPFVFVVSSDLTSHGMGCTTTAATAACTQKCIRQSHTEYNVSISILFFFLASGSVHREGDCTAECIHSYARIFCVRFAHTLCAYYASFARDIASGGIKTKTKRNSKKKRIKSEMVTQKKHTAPQRGQASWFACSFHQNERRII